MQQFFEAAATVQPVLPFGKEEQGHGTCMSACGCRPCRSALTWIRRIGRAFIKLGGVRWRRSGAAAESSRQMKIVSH